VEWDDVCFDYEPVASLGDEFATYKRIGLDFIDDWRKDRARNYSMLLYGPPGTGKTTVAENVADALNFRLITITVSDFLAGGEAMLEANAKAIFDVLTSQTDCVILFDEIDHFLLDRDSRRHSQQDTLFQFMTPGMLTKLNDLRRTKRVIFVIATNYESRIDLAIKRTGRIDHTYLLLPPDRTTRKRILTKLIEQEWHVAIKDRDPKLPIQSARLPKLDVGPNWERLLVESIFLGYKDMDGSVKEAKVGNLESLIEKLRGRARTTRLAPYLQRFKDDQERQKPTREFLALVRLALEVGVDRDLWVKGEPTELAEAADGVIDAKHEGRNAAERVIAAAKALGDRDERTLSCGDVA
jgi:SpoVK/Ycf46/Vps4 family AAA+-type ATPase